MTLEKAIEVLNRVGHHCSGDWRAVPTEDGDGFDVITGYDGDRLTEFEAIAVAEKYERERPELAECPRTKAEEVAHKIWLATIGRQHGITL